MDKKNKYVSLMRLTDRLRKNINKHIEKIDESEEQYIDEDYF